MSKSREPRKPARVIQIIAPGHRGIVAVRRCPTPRQALTEYYKDVLEPKGYTKPKHVGNTMQVVNKTKQVELYSAVDAKA